MRKKSRIKWLKEGDSNTAFFHKTINFRRHYNAIQGIFIDDVWVQQSKLIKDEAIKFFASRFTEEKLTRPILDGVQFKMITHTQREEMVAPFTDHELKEVVWSCGGDKCTGPDGFNFNFIKDFWGVLKPEFRRFVDEFHVNGSFPKGNNASFLALIPKTNNPQSFNDYRPISSL